MEKTIENPEGYETRIEGNKVILEKNESEDEKIRKALIEVFKKKLERGYEWVEYGIPNRSVLNWLEKQKEHPAEWSDVEKMHLANAILAAEKEWGVDSYTVKFLESLRPSWKPSEAQMKTLKCLPELFLKKEYKEYVEDDPVFSKLTSRNVGLAIARHFYELGLNERKEE